MITIKEETILNVPAKSVFNFLTNIDYLYKKWHPKDHVFCKTIFGSLSKKGCVFHFLEKIGWFPLYGVVKVTQIQRDEYIEYEPVFPLSRLKIFKGYFAINSLAPDKSQLVAYVEYGDRFGIFDKIANLFVNPVLVRKHIVEEGENLKNHLEAGYKGSWK